MTLEEFTNRTCSRKLLLSAEAREAAQTVISTMRVAELENYQLHIERTVLSQLTSLFFIEADILVIRSLKSLAIVTSMKSINSSQEMMDNENNEAA